MTREPADRAEPGPEADDDAELAALEAAAEQARHDARRAAQAVRLARRSRGGTIAPETPVADETEVVDATEVVDGTEVAERDAAVPAGAAAAATATTAKVSIAKPATAAPATKPASKPAGEATKPKPVAADSVTVDDAETDDTEIDETDAVDGSDADTDEEPAKARRRPRRVTVLATVFAVLAAVFVVVAAVVHANAQDDRSSSPAAARDAALLAARQDIVVLNTLDYNDVDGGLQRWLGATTGTLHDQLSQVSDSDKQAIAASKSVTTASVLAAAVTRVDANGGSATVIASVQIDVKPQTGDTTTKRSRFSLTMTEVGNVWKLGAVQQVGVTLS